MKKWALFGAIAAIVVAFAGTTVSGEKTAIIMPDEPGIFSSSNTKA